MRKTFLLCLSAFLLLLVPTLGAPDLDSLEALVRQWLDLKEEAGRVRSEWKERQALLQDELLMLERRKEQLAEAAAVERKNLEAAEAERAQAVQRRDRLQAALEPFKPSLLDSEEYLKTWQGALPFFLGHGLAEAFQGLRSGEEKSAPAEWAQRLQAVFNLYSLLEQMNGAVHADKAILKDDQGREREMDVLFFGLAFGFAVSADDRSAAFGLLTPQGLRWEWDPALAKPVRGAWACFNKERSAAFVELPLRVGGMQP